MTNSPNPGDVMEDGTIYVGETSKGEFLYAAPQDLSNKKMGWDRASMSFRRKEFTSLGHNDWKLPNKEELNMLFENRHEGSLEHSFNEVSIDDKDLYWSSEGSKYNEVADLVIPVFLSLPRYEYLAKSFSPSGKEEFRRDFYGAFVRLIRTAPKPQP